MSGGDGDDDDDGEDGGDGGDDDCVIYKKNGCEVLH